MISVLFNKMENYLSLKEIRENEEKAIQKGMTVEKMMDKAGYEIANFIDKNIAFNKAVFIAGTGNNGGDTLSAAFHLFNLKHQGICVFIIGKEEEIKEDPAKFLKLIKDMRDIHIQFVFDSSNIKDLQTAVTDSDLLVVGIFGTGFHSSLSSFHSTVIDIINNSNAKKISIDIPSGMNGDTGEFEKAVKSDFTITMQSMKTAFMNGKALPVCGKIILVDIMN